MNVLGSKINRKTILSFVLAQCLASGCAFSRAEDNRANTTSDGNITVAESVRAIDWNQATSDAQSIFVTRQAQRRDMKLAIPLLLPPQTMMLSNGESVSTEPVKIITDERGYSSMSKFSAFDILIDAANRSFATDDHTMQTVADEFDGDYQPIKGGGEISIGRYGALYSVQMQCHDTSQPDCGSERQIREIIGELEVRVDMPAR